MQIVIDIPDAPIKDYQDLYCKIYGMAANEGLFDDKAKSQRALALKVVLDILDGIVNGTPLPKGHGDLITKEQAIELVEFYQINPQHFNFVNLIDEIKDEKPIIEADRSEEK